MNEITDNYTPNWRQKLVVYAKNALLYTLIAIIAFIAISSLSACGNSANASTPDTVEPPVIEEPVGDVFIEVPPIDTTDDNTGIVAHCLNGVVYYMTFSGYLTVAYDVDGSPSLCGEIIQL